MHHTLAPTSAKASTLETLKVLDAAPSSSSLTESTRSSVKRKAKSVLSDDPDYLPSFQTISPGQDLREITLALRAADSFRRTDLTKRRRLENEEDVADSDRHTLLWSTAYYVPKSLCPTARRHCGSSWVCDSVSRTLDLFDGYYFSEVYGTGNWQARLPDALLAHENRRMSVAGEPIIDGPAPGLTKRPPPGSFVRRALDNEARHECQEHLDRSPRQRRRTTSTRYLTKIRALVRKSRPKKPKAEPKVAPMASTRNATRVDKSRTTELAKVFGLRAFSVYQTYIQGLD